MLVKNSIKIIHIQSVLSSQVPKSRMCSLSQVFTELPKPSPEVKNFTRQDLILKNNTVSFQIPRSCRQGGFQLQRSVNHKHKSHKWERWIPFYWTQLLTELTAGIPAGTGTVCCAQVWSDQRKVFVCWVGFPPVPVGSRGAGEAAGTEHRLWSCLHSGKVLEQGIFGLRLPQCHHFQSLCSRAVTHTAQGDPEHCKVLKFKAQRTTVSKGDSFFQN